MILDSKYGFISMGKVVNYYPEKMWLLGITFSILRDSDDPENIPPYFQLASFGINLFWVYFHITIVNFWRSK